MNTADKLLSYKKLLDGGVITTQEFEAKKNDILLAHKNKKELDKLKLEKRQKADKIKKIILNIVLTILSIFMLFVIMVFILASKALGFDMFYLFMGVICLAILSACIGTIVRINKKGRD